MKKTVFKTMTACGLCLSLLTVGASAAAGSLNDQMNARTAFNQMEMAFGSRQGGQFCIQPGGQLGGTQSTAEYAAAPSTVAEGLVTNSAASLTADYDNETTYDIGENGSVKISEPGTYIITGTCADGSITVKKGVTGVVLVLRDLDLASSKGAPLAINKNAEAKIIISGSVTLTDNENPEDETSTDADTADAYDGAAIKIKAGASACLTGDGTLTLNGSAKNGVKAGDETALVIDGALTLNITAANDAINGSYDVAILGGTLNISAGDDAIHADRILTIGADGNGPDITVSQSCEAIEATVVNIAGGTVKLTASDDGVNAANSNGTYASELAYSINITGGSLSVNTRTDGLDSNGNINLISGSATIQSANNGGDAGIDYDGSLYVSDEFELNNQNGVAGPDGMGRQMGGMRVQGQQDQQNQKVQQNQRNSTSDETQLPDSQNAAEFNASLPVEGSVPQPFCRGGGMMRTAPEGMMDGMFRRSQRPEPRRGMAPAQSAAANAAAVQNFGSVFGGSAMAALMGGMRI